MPELRAQRTLVKSPPELWAQVSDPVSLARHLGEFGEIKITRTVPEQTVAWEGERASGTVELSASGWGTKVTLVAQLSDDAEQTSEPEPAAAAAQPAQTRPADPFELINSIAREPLPRTAEPRGADEAEPDWSEAVAAAPAEQHPPFEAAVAEPAAVEEPAAVAEPAAVVDAPHEHLDPRDELVEQPDEAPEATIDQEHGHELDAWFAQSPDTADAAIDPTAWAPTTPAAARPGFFARLFGRRKVATLPVTAPTDPEGAWTDHDAAPTEADSAWTDHEAAPTDTESAWTDHEAASTDAEGAWTDHEAAPTDTESAWADHETETTAAETEPTEHHFAPSETESTWTEHEVEPVAPVAPETVPTEHEVAPSAAEPDPEPAEEPTASELEPGHEAPEHADDPVETLDVARAEAVLTAVLDDLGAARHRPFSRG